MASGTDLTLFRAEPDGAGPADALELVGDLLRIDPERSAIDESSDSLGKR